MGILAKNLSNIARLLLYILIDQKMQIYYIHSHTCTHDIELRRKHTTFRRINVLKLIMLITFADDELQFGPRQIAKGKPIRILSHIIPYSRESK